LNVRPRQLRNLRYTFNWKCEPRSMCNHCCNHLSHYGALRTVASNIGQLQSLSLFHSIPFHSIPFYSLLFHSIPNCSSCLQCFCDIAVHCMSPTSSELRWVSLGLWNDPKPCVWGRSTPRVQESQSTCKV
jgi:hypothetical protein